MEEKNLETEDFNYISEQVLVYLKLSTCKPNKDKLKNILRTHKDDFIDISESF